MGLFSRWQQKARIVRNALRYQRYVRRHPEELDNVILYITDRCNLRCRHCFYHAHVETSECDVSPLLVKELCRTIPKVDQEFAITGGEPFLHPSFSDIYRSVHDSPATWEIQVNTNGWFTDRIKDWLGEILEYHQKCLSIQISLDGLEQTHDKIRRKAGSFARAMETAQRLLAYFDPDHVRVPTFLMVVNSQNYMEIRPLAEMLYREFGRCLALELIRGPKTSCWGVPADILEDTDPPDLGLPPEEAFDEIWRTVQDLNREFGYPHHHFSSKMRYQFEMLRRRRPFVPCVSPLGRTAVIYPDGSVTHCEFTKPFANMKDFGGDFRALWFSPGAQERRKRIQHCYCTHCCALVPSMKASLKANLLLFRDL